MDSEDESRQCDLLLALGAVLGPAGEAQRAIEVVAPAAFALAEASGDAERAARVCEMALEELLRYGSSLMFNSEVYQEWVQRTERHAPPGSAARIIADISLAGQYVGQGRFTSARALAERALAHARQLDDDAVLLRALSLHLDPFWGPAHQAEQIALARELESFQPRSASLRELGTSLWNCHALHLVAGDAGRADGAQRELQALAERTQDPMTSLHAMCVEVARAMLRGALDEALALGTSIGARGEALGMPVTGRHFTALVTFTPLLYLGRTAEALDLHPAARRRAGLGETASGLAMGRQALVLAEMGELEEAGRLLRSALATLRAGAEADETPSSVLIHLLETALILQDLAAASLLRDRLPGIVAAIRGGSLINVARPRAAAAAMLGDHAAARADLDRSLDWATRIGSRPEIALTRLAMAELLVDGADQAAEASALLDAALPELEAMGMAPAVARARRCRAAIGMVP